MEKTFWAPKPNCKKDLNDKGKQVLNNMRGSRERGVSSVDRVAMDINKRKLEKVLKVQQRKHNEEQQKWILSHPFLLSKAKTKKAVYQAMLVKTILNLACLELQKKKQKRKFKKKQPVVNLNLGPTHWSKTVSLVANKQFKVHHLPRPYRNGPNFFLHVRLTTKISPAKFYTDRFMFRPPPGPYC